MAASASVTNAVEEATGTRTVSRAHIMVPTGRMPTLKHCSSKDISNGSMVVTGSVSSAAAVAVRHLGSTCFSGAPGSSYFYLTLLCSTTLPWT